MDKTEFEGFSPDYLHDIQQEVQKAVDEGKLSGKDPAIQKLLTEFLQDKNLHSFVEKHEQELSSLIHELTELGIIETKIQNLFSALFFETSSLEEYKKPVSFEFISDIDAPDHNGVILQDFNFAIESEHPVITTRTLFRGQAVEKASIFIGGYLHERDKKLKFIQEKYDIWSKGAFLLFIPKNLGENLTEKQRLEKLDLKSSALEKISLEKAWELTDETPTIEEFQNLFSKYPLHDKMIHIAGHGDTGNPAGLNQNHYEKFLQWLEKTHCVSLLVTSCYSGGKSALLHLPKSDEEGKSKESLKGVTFPVVVRSISDFTTFHTETEKNVRDFFLHLHILWSTSGGKTVPRLKQLVKKHEEGKEKKSSQNLIQVFFPSSRDSPAGFLPIGEGGESYPLTYNRFRKEQIEKGKILMKGKEFLELFPAIIDCPIEFEEQNPILFSMILGEAHHVLTQVKLSSSLPKEFLEEQIEFYQKANIGVEKTFFISSLTSDKEQITQVFICLKSGECGYFQNGEYYVTNLHQKEKPLPVSPFQFALSWKNAIDKSEADANALRFATGGQQGKKEIFQCLTGSFFWENQKKIYETYREFLETDSSEMSLDFLQKMADSLRLSESDRISLLFDLLSKNEQLALAFFEKNKFPLDVKDERGNFLLIHAVQNNSLAFTKFLIQKGADLNVQDPLEGKTPLVFAIQYENKEIVDFLINQDTIDLELKIKRGNPSFFSLIFQEDALKVVLRKNPNLNLNSTFTTIKGEKKSLLAIAVKILPLSTMKVLLENGANPNGINEEVKPLEEAILKNDLDKISLLLAYKANPFEKNANKHSSISHAMRTSSLEIVKILLEKSGYDATKEDKIDLFLQACASADEAKIRFSFQLNPIFPKNLSWTQSELLTIGLNRLFAFGREDLIQDIIKQMNTTCENTTSFITKFYLDKAPEKLKEMMQKEWNLLLLIQEVIRKELPSDLSIEIVQKAIDLGVNLNDKKGIYPYFPLRFALEKKKLDLVKFLLNKGADPNVAKEEIIELEDLTLLKLAVEKGLNLAEKPSILRRVSNLDLSKKEVQEIFQWLVEKGGDLNDFYLNKTPFEEVISSGNFELYRFCLQHGGNKILEKKGELEHLAGLAATSRTEDGEKIVKELVEKGADLNNMQNKDHVTLFTMIVRYGSLALVKWCFDKGVDLNPKNPSLKISLLQAAVLNRHSDSKKIFKYLIEKGVNIQERGYKNMFPILLTISKKDLEFVKLCFEKGAKLETKEDTEKAFSFALEQENDEILNELLKQGYHFSMKEWDKNRTVEFLKDVYDSGKSFMLEKALSFSPSKEALQLLSVEIEREMLLQDDFETFQLLEKNGVIFDPKKVAEAWERKALFSKEGSLKIIKEVLNRIDQKDRLLFLANILKICIQQENIHLLKYALENGLDPNFLIQGLGEDKPLIFEAIQTKNPEIIKTILEKNPDLSLKAEGKTPLQYAKSLKDDAIIRLIQEKMRK